jgi:hypothetical protein
MLSAACEAWKHFVAFMYFVLRFFCCYVALSACYILLVLCCSACANCSMIVCIVILIVFNNLPRDCGWKLAGWLKLALLLKRWLMCTVPVKIQINSTQWKPLQRNPGGIGHSPGQLSGPLTFFNLHWWAARGFLGKVSVSMYVDDSTLSATTASEITATAVSFRMGGKKQVSPKYSKI